MKQIVLTALAIVALAYTPIEAGSDMNRETLAQMAVHYRFFKILADDDEGRMRYIYADEGPHLHVYAMEKNGRSALEWETIVGSQIRGLELVTTVDGRRLFVVATARGKLFAYDADEYELVRENLLEPFSSIQAMAIAEIDGDKAQEVILLGVRDDLAEPHLYVYDGDSRSLQWDTQETFKASEILVANLDDDVQPEIILNTGTILDSRFRTIETEYLQDGGFGTRLRLLDITGDGIPEIFGNSSGDQIRVYDPGASRRLW